ncbi:putative 30S ribosomal subunit protein S14 [Candidatus Zinderia insecticola CARI]|uniref:Small ribosomal subunit protein uS14 n=1 Tax=Zinderia insecticola (strain CARI) TaxID=871271 RepID=E0TJ35_ZINIC|nr:putative 30S ribosomal subunit protein S14 [Candidatus Zinderia insecticola CARI]
MSKLSIINREKKRELLILKYKEIRNNLKKNIKNEKNIKKKYNLIKKLQNLPRNSNPTRKRNRCFLTGRSRGYFRRFGLSRIKIREMAIKGEIPGIIKASW